MENMVSSADKHTMVSSFLEVAVGHTVATAHQFLQAPQVHYIVHRKLGVHEFLLSSPMVDPNPMQNGGIREGLLSHLTIALGNDGIATTFLFLHLLSRVHTRVGITALADYFFCSVQKSSGCMLCGVRCC